jgi:hypothetical protein
MIKSGSIKWVMYVACIGPKISEYTILVGEPEGKRSLGRYGHRKILKWI